MHIPEHFVSAPVNGLAALAAVSAMVYSYKKIRKDSGKIQGFFPLLATMTAFIFSAQMLNFPIGSGTSGHFLGAVALALLFGPWAACLSLSLILAVQAFFFADGGILELGVNILNMGIIGGMLVYPLMRAIRNRLPAGRAGFLAAAAVTSWLSIVLASTACALELAISGTSSLAVVVPAMAGTHMIIGIGEALITVAVVSAVTAVRPDLLPSWAHLEETKKVPALSSRQLALAGVALAVILAIFVSPYASTAPDGLEKVAQDLGFAE